MTTTVEGSSSSARIKCVRISMHGLATLCLAGTSWLTKTGLPEGAKAVAVNHYPSTGIVLLFVQHDSFPELELGAEVEDVVVTFSNQTKE